MNIIPDSKTDLLLFIDPTASIDSLITELQLPIDMRDKTELALTLIQCSSIDESVVLTMVNSG